MKQSIENIRFDRVGQNKGCTCDRCGQYIRNIWTVKFSGGMQIAFGIDCFERMYKSGSLTASGIKAFKKLLKRIQAHKESFEMWQTITEEEAIANYMGWIFPIYDKDSAFYGMTFDEYREWMLNEFYAQRFREDEEALTKFRKFGFEI